MKKQTLIWLCNAPSFITMAMVRSINNCYDYICTNMTWKTTIDNHQIIMSIILSNVTTGPWLMSHYNFWGWGWTLVLSSSLCLQFESSVKQKGKVYDKREYYSWRTIDWQIIKHTSNFGSIIKSKQVYIIWSKWQKRTMGGSLGSTPYFCSLFLNR